MRSYLHTSTHGECIKGSLVYLWIRCNIKGEGPNNVSAGEVTDPALCVYICVIFPVVLNAVIIAGLF